MASMRTRKVSLCGKELHGLQHICAFFDSRKEMYDILNPYFQEGIDTGDEVVTILESSVHDDHVNRMQSGGVPVQDAIQRGQLKVVPSEQTYLQDNVFVADRMLSTLEGVLQGAAEGEFKSVRTCGDMEWALKSLPGTEDLMVYEAKVNTLAPKHDCTLLCCYDVNRFSGRVIADVLATHSHVVIGGHVHENPYYLDPVTFLKKLALRRAPVALANAG
ncbi:MEDS domain-containing protein [Sorangium sp. So ce381]|uniref:MEDS domain-containing protein n=1 Tax=Sorangium sp. So ce381 TaxID=3133307 RepID=UPI003F5C7332